MDHHDLTDYGHLDHSGDNHLFHDLPGDVFHLIDDLANGHRWQDDFKHIVEDVVHPFDPSIEYVEQAGGAGFLAGHLPQFDYHVQHDGVIGHPNSEVAQWHLQNHNDTCAVASQEFILNELTGYHFSEETLRQEAYQHGWYTPGGGTPLEDVGKLLTLHGVPVAHHYGTTLDQLAMQLQEGHEVIVCLNGEDIWSPEQTDNSPLSNYVGMPGQQADHAVEVIGIDTSNSHGPMVILNDPGHPDGRGMEVSIPEFMQAWSTSDNYMVFTGGTADASSQYTASTSSVGGYFNADGTYHYDSDNTDRDPETGAVIRSW